MEPGPGLQANPGAHGPARMRVGSRWACWGPARIGARIVLYEAGAGADSSLQGRLGLGPGLIGAGSYCACWGRLWLGPGLIGAGSGPARIGPCGTRKGRFSGGGGSRGPVFVPCSRVFGVSARLRGLFPRVFARRFFALSGVGGFPRFPAPFSRAVFPRNPPRSGRRRFSRRFPRACRGVWPTSKARPG